MLGTNPWRLLSPTPPYVLEMDVPFVERHNASAASAHKIMANSVPEPFIGNPDTAQLVLLSLNPGHCERDAVDHARPAIKESLFRNLKHEPQEYPFYPLDPAFDGTGVANWWRKRLRRLQEAADLTTRELATKLMVIEWFPYHSEKCSLRGATCSSQNYSFELAREMHRRGAVVVGMRSRKLWQEVDPMFQELPFLRNPQNTSVSPGNMASDVFTLIAARLREH